MKLSLATSLLAIALPAVAARLNGVPTSVASDEAELTWHKKLGWHTVVGVEIEMHSVDGDDGNILPLEDPTVVTAYKAAFEETFDAMETKWAFIDSAFSRKEGTALSNETPSSLGWGWGSLYCRTPI